MQLLIGGPKETQIECQWMNNREILIHDGSIKWKYVEVHETMRVRTYLWNRILAYEHFVSLRYDLSLVYHCSQLREWNKKAQRENKETLWKWTTISYFCSLLSQKVINWFSIDFFFKFESESDTSFREIVTCFVTEKYSCRCIINLESGISYAVNFDYYFAIIIFLSFIIQ